MIDPSGKNVAVESANTSSPAPTDERVVAGSDGTQWPLSLSDATVSHKQDEAPLIIIPRIIIELRISFTSNNKHDTFALLNSDLISRYHGF